MFDAGVPAQVAERERLEAEKRRVEAELKRLGDASVEAASARILAARRVRGVLGSPYRRLAAERHHAHPADAHPTGDALQGRAAAGRRRSHAAALGAHLSGRLLGRFVRSTAHRVGGSRRTRVLDRDVGSRWRRAAGACRMAVAGAQPRCRTGGVDRGAVQAGEPGAEAQEGPPRRHRPRRLRTEAPLSSAEEAPRPRSGGTRGWPTATQSKLTAAHAALTTAVGAARAARRSLPVIGLTTSRRRSPRESTGRPSPSWSRRLSSPRPTRESRHGPGRPAAMILPDRFVFVGTARPSRPSSRSDRPCHRP